METTPQSIHEQEADNERDESQPAGRAALPEMARARLANQLKFLHEKLRKSKIDKSMKLEDAANAQGALDILSRDLIGMTPKELVQKELLEFEDRAIDIFEELMAVSPRSGLIIQGLAGMDSPRAWRLREKMLGIPDADMLSLAGSLACLDSPQANNMREFIYRTPNKSHNRHRVAMVRSVTGVDTQRAWEIRDWALSGEIDPMLHSLVGLESDRAWELRERWLPNENKNEAVAKSLAGMDTDQAWEMRGRFGRPGLEATAEVSKLLGFSIVGLDSDKAWEVRDSLAQSSQIDWLVMESLAGLDSERAWKMREDIETLGMPMDWMLNSLTGSMSERAWNVRHEVLRDSKDDLLFDDSALTAFVNSFSGQTAVQAAGWRAAKGLLPHQQEQGVESSE